MQPTDPLFAAQWHFDLIGDIETIWDEFTGDGVSVGIYDEGVQSEHPDLDDNYDAAAELVVGGEAVPGDASGPHGTSVAGLIAAEANGEDTVGVAFGATVTGIDIFDSSSPAYVNALDNTGFLDAAGQAASFDISNNSWGSTPSYFSSQNLAVAGSFAAELDAQYELVSATGRDGLGTIVLQAAGNDHLNANADGVNASRFTVTVAATRDDGFASSYTNFGSSILVAAPAGDFAEEGSLGLVTTDLLDRPGYNLRSSPNGSFDFTDDFGGTSGATPIVSGVVALMLDANPGLGWRDVQNILAASATETGSGVGGTLSPYETNPWTVNGAHNWNGGGMHYSPDYGYGMVNAYNAVRMAETWDLFASPQTSANEHSVSTGPIDAGATIVDQSTLEYQFEVQSELVIEHIQITLTLTHSDFRDLDIFLISPDGTEMMLQQGGAGGAGTSDDGLTWTFGIDGLRGELVDGTWTVRIVDDAAGDAGSLDTVEFTAYGSPSTQDDVYHYTDELPELMALDPTRWILADVDRGYDWLDLAAVSSPVVADLRPGIFAYDGAIVKIVENAVIEAVVTGDGADRLFGSDRDDNLHSMRGEDFLAGRGGDDILAPGQDEDIVQGGSGEDTASYADAAAGVSVFIRAGFGGEARNDCLLNVENLIGSDFDDLLIGGSGPAGNALYGEAGNDHILAGAGIDRIYGGAGLDRLQGGAGKDFFSVEDGDGLDIIIDFQAGSDVLAFTDVDGVERRSDLHAIEVSAGLLVGYGGDAMLLAGIDSVEPGDLLFV